jgi:serine/threonine protein kinase
VLNIIEKIHASGHTYNDLKLDNIMISNASQSRGKVSKLHLIDFGFASNFCDRNGQHLGHDDLQHFRGNIIFATFNQMAFKRTSRKDDLVSLCYMLVYLFNGPLNVSFIARDPQLSR